MGPLKMYFKTLASNISQVLDFAGTAEPGAEPTMDCFFRVYVLGKYEKVTSHQKGGHPWGVSRYVMCFGFFLARG